MVILIGFIIGIFLHKAFLKRKQKSSHLWRQKSAEKIHNSIKSIKHNGQIISYLRKVEPFVFEELLLIAVAQNPKCKVIKNDRYTGDGGIDGKFILNNRLYIIQAKRYKSHIDSKDILDFIKKINESKAYKGLFIHTGKTGSQSWEFSSIDDNIEIISGNKLVHLMQFGYANTH
jgi:restriction system protein